MTSLEESRLLYSLTELFKNGGGEIALEWEDFDILPHDALVALFNKRLTPKGFTSPITYMERITLEIECTSMGYQLILSINDEFIPEY